MNLQERNQLTSFLTQLEQAQVPEKLPDADELIRQSIARQPDAAYLLVQRSMLLEQALNAAKEQIAKLQMQLQESRNPSQGGFLNANPWNQSAPARQPNAAIPGSANYQMPRAAAVPGPVASAGPSFLGNVASTAAGVVAGSFLFQGIESLLGHHSSTQDSSNEAFNDQPVEQTVINNYYGSDSSTDWNSQDAPDSFLPSDDNYFTDDSDDSSWV